MFLSPLRAAHRMPQCLTGKRGARKIKTFPLTAQTASHLSVTDIHHLFLTTRLPVKETLYIFKAYVAGTERDVDGSPSPRRCKYMCLKQENPTGVIVTSVSWGWKLNFFNFFLQLVGDLRSFDKHWPFLQTKEEIFCVDCQRLSNRGSSKSVLYTCAVFSSYNHMIQFVIKCIFFFSKSENIDFGTQTLMWYYNFSNRNLS